MRVISTIIITTGGGGHEALTRLVVIYPHANANQKAAILALIAQFTSDAKALADQIEAA